MAKQAKVVLILRVPSHKESMVGAFESRGINVSESTYTDPNEAIDNSAYRLETKVVVCDAKASPDWKEKALDARIQELKNAFPNAKVFFMSNEPKYEEIVGPYGVGFLDKGNLRGELARKVKPYLK